MQDSQQSKQCKQILTCHEYLLLYNVYQELQKRNKSFTDIFEKDEFNWDKFQKFLEVMKQDKQNILKSSIIFDQMGKLKKSFGLKCLKQKCQNFLNELQKNSALAVSVKKHWGNHVQERVFKLFRLVPGQDVQKYLQKQKQLMQNSITYKDQNNPKFEEGEYKYAHEIFKNGYELFSMTDSVIMREQSRQGIGLKAQPKDVSQGLIGNCYLMSSLISIISKHPEVIFYLFLFEVSLTRYYVVKLFIDGQWIMIETDDQFPVIKFPVSQNEKLIYAGSHGQKIWVMLLQKCYAKLFGSYQALDSGPLSQGFRVLTGAPTEVICLQSFLSHENQKKVEDEERVLLKILHALQKLFVISIAPSNYLQSLSQQDQKKIGLVKGHAYSILDIFKVQQEWVVMLMNPWGMNSNQDYYGRWKWSFKQQKWTAELKKKHWYLNEGKDGRFYMPWKKLTLYFSEFTICKMVPSYFHSSKKLEIQRDRGNYFYVNVKVPGQYYFSVYHESKRKYNDPKFKYPDTKIVVLKKIPENQQKQTPQKKHEKPKRIYQYINSINTSSKSCVTVENQFLSQGLYLVYVKIQWGKQTQRQVIFCSYGTAQVQYPEQFLESQKSKFRNQMIFSLSQKFTSNKKSEQEHGQNIIRVKKPFVIKGVEKNGYMEIFVSRSIGLGYIKIKNKTQQQFHFTLTTEKFSGLRATTGIKQIDLCQIIKPRSQTVVGLWVDPVKKLQLIPKLEMKSKITL